MLKGTAGSQNDRENRPFSGLAAILLLAVLFVLCTSGIAGAFDFDWRAFISYNTATLWPQPPERLTLPKDGTGLSERQYCRLLAYDGAGAQIVRSIVLASAKADKSAPPANLWLKTAMQERFMPLPAVADINRDTACSLALILAAAKSDDPDRMLRNIDFERLAKCGAVPAWLWSLRENGVKLSSDTLSGIAQLIRPDDRVLVYSVAAAFPDTYSELIAKGISEGEPFDRALAFLALSHLPNDKLPANLLESLKKLLSSGDNWATMLTALAYYRLHEPISARMFEGFLTHSDPGVAACAAIAVGANANILLLRSTLADTRIPPVVRGHIVVGAATRSEPEFNTLIDVALASDETILRQFGAIAIGMRGEDVSRLATLFQDIAYEVRASAAVGAGLSRGRSTFGVLKSFIQDKHHEELSAVASSFLAARPSDATTRLLAGIPEYLFDRERGLALMSLGAASKEEFDKAQAKYRNANSPYLRRMLAIGGLLSGDGAWLNDLDRAIGEFQDYRPFGDQVSLRRAAAALLVPDPFDYMLDFCFDR